MQVEPTQLQSDFECPIKKKSMLHKIEQINRNVNFVIEGDNVT